MLYFILNYSAHAWLSTYTTAQANKNMATSKEIATYIATTRVRQRDEEIAITKLVHGVHRFHLQICTANIIWNAL